MKTIKIYTLKHPITYEIRYIGKTIKTLEERLFGHIREAKYIKSKGHKNNWVKSLLNQNLEPIIELLDEIPYEENWEWLEQYWISQFKVWGFRLTNMTEGGDGNKNQIFSEESYKKRSETIKNRILSGEIDYKERSKKISKALTGLKRSEETKEKLRQINLGKKYSDETLLKKNKGILKFSLNGQLLDEYISLTKVLEQEPTYTKTMLSNACREEKEYKGFLWKYKRANKIKI